jgi:hypothetical protein
MAITACLSGWMSVHDARGLHRPISAWSDWMKPNNSSFHQQICAVNRYSNYKEDAHIVLPPAVFKQVGSNVTLPIFTREVPRSNLLRA